MAAAANLVEVAALVGDTARATMLAALMGGQSLTATELAYYANVSRSTASSHLSKLVAARLLTVTRKRRLELGRKIPRDVHEDARDAARRKMKTKAFLRSRPGIHRAPPAS